MTTEVTIVECPRDAWQGLRQVIPTVEKVRYLSRLMKLGFCHIDAVSFVSPKHVPQMADSEAVMQQLSEVKTGPGKAPEIIGIVVNAHGLERAGKKLSDAEKKELYESTRATYEHQTDPRYAAARLWVDAIIDPARTREALIEALESAGLNPHVAEFKTGVLQT